MTFFPPVTRISFFPPQSGNQLLSLSPGWYFVQIISAISMLRLSEIQNLANITFTTRYLVYPGCYSFYLNESQLNILQHYNELSINQFPKIYSKLNQKIERETGRCKLKAISNWKPQNPDIKYSSFSNDIFIANTTCFSLLPDDRIEYLSPYTGLKTANRYNSGYIQSGSQEGVIENGFFTSPHPIFNIGIRGENQIISIIDTGVDFNHAFFKDPNPEFQDTIPINTTIKNHRKIEKYYNFAKINDGECGHGTHCAGILLGESYVNDSGLIMYSGMAPKAKLVVGDVGYGGKDLEGEFNQIELINLFEKDGVSVCSNSWGFNTNENTKIDTMMYDYISFIHPDMLFVFAAGNEGKKGFYTINSPGDSKNLLSVGGLTPTRLQSIESTRQWRIEINGHRYKSQSNTAKGINPIKSTRGNPMKKLFNLSIIDYNDQITLDSMKNKIVFLNDTNENDLFCDTFLYFSEKENIIKSPAAIIHIENNYTKCKSAGFLFPIFEVNDYEDSKSSEPFVDSIKSQIKLSSTASIYELIGSQSPMRLADYSSKGPSPLGLNKPDVVVPGTAYSSCARKNTLTTYDLRTKGGTSMATPAAAGVCSLIRQYFYDGYYPYRNKNSSKSFVPASYLIRAVLINSASPFNSDNYGPNIETGFGSPNISSSLLEPLRIVKKMSIRQNEKHLYSINLNANNSSLRITLGYIDPPLEVSSPIPLYADLDLLVISPSGKLFIGNERPNHQTEMANTLERVIVKKEEVEIGKYTILVLSNNFSDPDLDSINYSIVINGPFDHFDFETNKENLKVKIGDKNCQFQCLNNGKCGNKGVCVCDSDHAGFDCSIKFNRINLNETNTFNFIPNEYQNYKTLIGNIKNRTNITISVKLNTDDKYASLLLYVSDSKFNTISDANVVPSQIYSKTQSTLNLTIYPNEGDEEDLYLYLTLLIVSAYQFKVDINIDAVDFPLGPNETIPIPSPASTATNIIPSPSNVIETESLNMDNFVARATSNLAGLYKISFVLSFAMITLSVVLIIFMVIIYIQIKRRKEINKFYARDEEEPKITIMEKDIDI